MSAETRITRAAEAEGFGSKKTPSRGIVVGLLILILVLIGLVGTGIWFLMQPGAPTEMIRDIVIIIVAFEFMLVGLALVILIVQLANLLNLLQNEVRPILDSASEAANTLRGTARFLSDNLAGPVVKASGAVAALRRAAEMLNFFKRK